MGKMKKSGENSKATEARNRKAQSKAEGNARVAKQKEDAYWEAAGEGQKTKAQKKKEEAAMRKKMAAEKKMEARKLAVEEEANLVKSKKVDKGKPMTKVTRAQLEAQKQIDLEIQKQQMRKREQEKKHTVTPEEYEEVVSRPNLNREEDLLIARGVDQAISGLSEMGIADPAASPDPHPEKRLKAAYLAFQEAELPLLKEEKPGLSLKQYKDMLWKAWKKAHKIRL